MNLSRRKRRRGMTLLEMMGVLFISGVVLALFAISTNSINHIHKDKLIIEEIETIRDFVHNRFASLPSYDNLNADTKNYGNKSVGFPSRYWNGSSIIDLYGNTIQLYSTIDAYDGHYGKSLFHIVLNNVSDHTCQMILEHNFGPTFYGWNVGGVDFHNVPYVDVNSQVSVCHNYNGMMVLEFT